MPLSINFLFNAFLCFAFSIVSLLSLISHNSLDPSLNVSNANIISNLLGTFGSVYSDILLQFLGKSAYVFCFIPVTWPFIVIKTKNRLLAKKYRYTSFIIFTCTIAILFSNISNIINAKYSYGGAIGQLLSSSKIVHGTAIYSILYWALLCCFIILSTVFTLCTTHYIKHITSNITSIFKRKVTKKQKHTHKKENVNFALPPISLLTNRSKKIKTYSEEQLASLSKQLIKTLSDFGIYGTIIGVQQGPVVTLYEFEPAAGTKSSRVIGLADDIARSLGSVSVRIAIISRKKVLGIEIPNNERAFFGIKELIESPEYTNSKDAIPIILGKSLSGEPNIIDLTKMPHLLIAGTTGSGKSVSINTLILSMLYRYTPQECRMIMIDPKMLELSLYADIPHLLTNVVTDSKKAVAALKWTVKEMEKRYKLMSIAGVRNIESYNAKCLAAQKSSPFVEKKIQTGFDPESGLPTYEDFKIKAQKLPFIVVIVDEMADLMLTAGKEVEISIQRLSQMARASGIHLIMATQRPSVDVITGVIKANFPSRISFKVASKIDSRTVISTVGAEQLLGAGDMLYSNNATVTRVHGPFVSDDEIHKVVTYLKQNYKVEYIEEVTKACEKIDDFDSKDESRSASGNSLYEQAVSIVEKEKKVSISYIQRRLHIGYNKAASIIEKMEEEQIISPPSSSGKREVIGR